MTATGYSQHTEWLIHTCSLYWLSSLLHRLPDTNRRHHLCILLSAMDEYIDSLGEAAVFLTVAASSGYWQIEIDELDCHKTAIVSHHGLYLFTTMQLGLKDDPGTSHTVVDVILASVCWHFMLGYLDDIVVFSKSLADHMRQDWRLMRLLLEAKVTVKRKTCKFFSETTDYLGHVNWPSYPKRAGDNTNNVANLDHLTKQAGNRSFLGLCNVFGRFVQSFVCLPLFWTIIWETTNLKPSSPLLKRRIPQLLHGRGLHQPSSIYSS